MLLRGLKGVLSNLHLKVEALYGLTISDSEGDQIKGQDPFNMNKSPLKNFMKKPQESSQPTGLYEFIQSRKESPDKAIHRESSRPLTTRNDRNNKRSLSAMVGEDNSGSSKHFESNKSRKENPTQRKNFLELNKIKLRNIKTKKSKPPHNKTYHKINKASGHRKTRSNLEGVKKMKKTGYIPPKDKLLEALQLEEKEAEFVKHTGKTSQLTDVYIENESEYDIINDLKRDIMRKEGQSDMGMMTEEFLLTEKSGLSQLDSVRGVKDISQDQVDLINGNCIGFDRLSGDLVVLTICRYL